MTPIKKIMVAVDFSDHSFPAAEYAFHLAENVGADLLMVNVINQRDVDMLKKVAQQVPTFSLESHLAEIHDDRKTGFGKLVDEIGADGARIQTVIRIGVPFQELLDVISSEKVDLVVMATKGRSNLVDTIVGSCALKMFRYSPIPVVSVRERHPRAGEAP